MPTVERVSRRRTSAQHGYVNFPVNDERLRSTGEGGMFVKLVVVDDREYDDTPWTICCGAGITDHLTEQMVGDDQAEAPRLELAKPDESAEQALAAIQAHDAAHKAWEGRHFPFLDDEDQSEGKYRSRQYLASMLLGITGWSGYDDAKEAYWRCTRDDLSDDGKALVTQLERLYPNCTIHLLTFLDT
jgi:hypothetical protein